LLFDIMYSYRVNLTLGLNIKNLSPCFMYCFEVEIYRN